MNKVTEGSHNGVHNFVGEFVSVQFRGQVLLYKSVMRGDALSLMPVLDKMNGEMVPVVTQSVDSVRLMKVEDDAYTFEMTAPGGGVAEFRLAKELVAVIWRPIKAPSTLLAV